MGVKSTIATVNIWNKVSLYYINYISYVLQAYNVVFQNGKSLINRAARGKLAYFIFV